MTEEEIFPPQADLYERALRFQCALTSCETPLCLHLILEEEDSIFEADAVNDLRIVKALAQTLLMHGHEPGALADLVLELYPAFSKSVVLEEIEKLRKRPVSVCKLIEGTRAAGGCEKELCEWQRLERERHSSLTEYNNRGGQEEAQLISEEELKALPPVENPRLEVLLESDNFLCQYMEYASLKSDAYNEYHYASALFLISTAIERKVVLARRQGTVYPNLWLFCLGDSTISRKTTALREPGAILDTYEPGRKLPGSFSPEALIEALADCPRSFLLKDEAGSLLASLGKKYMEEARDFFADIFECGDYYRKLRTSQRKDKLEFRIIQPYITQLLATTPDNFREYTSLIDLTSGWLLRYIYFYPTHLKPWKPFEAANDEDFSKYTAISIKYRDLKEKLAHLELEGLKLNLTPEGWDYFAQWQRSIEEEAMRGEDNLLKAVAGRLMTAALKLAVVFTVGRSDFDPNETKDVSLEHIKEATRQVESYFLPLARIVAEEVARSERENLQNQVIGTLRRAGGVLSRRALLRKLHAKLRDVAEAIEALVESGELEVRQTEGKGGDQVVYVLTVSSVPSVSFVSYVPSVTGIQDNSTRSDRDKSTRLLETPETFVTEETLETPGTEEKAPHEKIRRAIAEGATDPLKLSEFCGLPVEIVSRDVARYPGIDLQKAGKILVNMSLACWWPPRIKEQRERAEKERQAREEHFRELAEKINQQRLASQELQTVAGKEQEASA